MKKVLLKLNDGKAVLVISKELKQQLLDSNSIFEDTLSNCWFKDVVFIELEQEPQTKGEKVANVKDWYQEWRELFPKGVNSNGYPYRGDKEACLAKMQKFVRNNSFSKEEIFQATKIAVNRSKLNEDMKYLPLAHYFIYKNETSSLKQFCEMVKDGIIKHVSEESSYEEKL